jgi:hypothetical protein
MLSVFEIGRSVSVSVPLSVFLRQLVLTRFPPETTGLADPAPILQTFFINKTLSAHFRVDAIVTVVDAKVSHTDSSAAVSVCDYLSPSVLS